MNEQKQEEIVPRKIGEGKREDYAYLVEEFQKACQKIIDAVQEADPREIRIVSIYSDSRSGLACWTNERGIPQLIQTKEEPGPQAKMFRQRFFLGLQIEAVTKGRAIKSASIRKKKFPEPEMYNLLEPTVEAAKDEGDKIQDKINEGYQWFEVYFSLPEENIVAADTEPDPDSDTIMDLVAHAWGKLAARLGAKAEKIEVELVKIVEHMLYADFFVSKTGSQVNLIPTGSKTDLVYPRMSFFIHVKTKRGNTAYGTIRGSGGTIKEIFARHVNQDAPAEKKEPRAVIDELIDEVVKEVVDLDRAQPVTIIGASECPVMLSSRVSGIRAHECDGHTAEADIICENRRKKDVGVRLDSRIGAKVSDHPRLTIIDTPEKEFKLGEHNIRYAWGALPVDGYGNYGKVVTIVENGIMKGVMSDRHTLNEILSTLQDPILTRIKETGITGNVRREKFDQPPLIRMRNTFILPDESGPSTKEEMAKLITPITKKGLYVRSAHGGSINPDSGDFQINCNLCYLIESGMINFEKPIKNVVITGNIKQTNLVKAIGNSKTIRHPFSGWCGKNGQIVPVDGGGPLLYIESARLGGGADRPWEEIVKDYFRQHREVKEGKRGLESINIPEFREIVKDQEPQNKVHLFTIFLPFEEELRYLFGTDNFATHEIDEKGKLVEKRDRYE